MIPSIPPWGITATIEQPTAKAYIVYMYEGAGKVSEEERCVTTLKRAV